MFLDVSIELLGRGVGIRFRPAGDSMHPTIRDGEPVTVAPISAAQVKRGDIILYRTERGLKAHRVVLINRGIVETETTIILQGDACSTLDEPVRAGQVLGKVVSVERDGRKVSLAGRRAYFAYLLRLHAHSYFVRVLRDRVSRIRV